MFLIRLPFLFELELEMLVLEERGKPESTEKNLLKKITEQTINSAHIWSRRQDGLNSSRIGERRRVLSPLYAPSLHPPEYEGSRCFMTGREERKRQRVYLADTYHQHQVVIWNRMSPEFHLQQQISSRLPVDFVPSPCCRCAEILNQRGQDMVINRKKNKQINKLEKS